VAMSSRPKIFYKPGNADYTDTHTYYNASMVNSSEVPIIANYVDNRDDELISDPENWHISIERADIDALYIPLFNFITDGYHIKLSYDTFTYDVALQYISESTVDIAFDNTLPIYSVQHFLRMINNAFTSAFNSLKVNITNPLFKPAYAPYIVYDSATKLFSLVADIKYDSLNPPDPGKPIIVSMNTRLFNMLSGGWNYTYYGPSPPANSLEYQVHVYGQFNNTITITDPKGVIPTTFAYLMRCEYVSGNLKDAVKLILTTSMPIQREYIPSLSGTTTTTGGNSTQAILTDFSIGSQPDDIGRPGYLYIPQYPRNIDLVGNIPLRNVTMAVFWQDRSGKVLSLIHI
jgi:hypothetical protein